MTSKEIVQRAIRFQRPSRLPVIMDCFGVSDIGGVWAKAAAGFEPQYPGQDEWGCIWEKTEQHNMGQVKGHPLEDIRQMDSMLSPDYTDDSRFVEIDRILEQHEKNGKYTQCGIFMVLFERMHSLHGFENTLVDLYEDRPAMEALADRIVETHITFVRELARRFPNRLDAWNMTDDWGTQTAAFISFDLWMDFFFPCYKRIFDAMHEAGCDVWVHSCGKVNEIIEGLIRAGANAVNLQQPRALGIEEVGKRYCGRITFESLSDIQASLPSGNRTLVAEDAEQLMKHWATPEGGFVLADYGDDAAIGVLDAGMKLYMYQEFSKWSERLYGEPLPEPKVSTEA